MSFAAAVSAEAPDLAWDRDCPARLGSRAGLRFPVVGEHVGKRVGGVPGAGPFVPGRRRPFPGRASFSLRACLSGSIAAGPMAALAVGRDAGKVRVVEHRHQRRDGGFAAGPKPHDLRRGLGPFAGVRIPELGDTGGSSGFPSIEGSLSSAAPRPTAASGSTTHPAAARCRMIVTSKGPEGLMEPMGPIGPINPSNPRRPAVRRRQLDRLEGVRGGLGDRRVLILGGGPQHSAADFASGPMAPSAWAAAVRTVTALVLQRRGQRADRLRIRPHLTQGAGRG